MSTPEEPEPHTIRNVPIPVALAAELLTPESMARWGTVEHELRLAGHDLGLYKVVALRADWDARTQLMLTFVDLQMVWPRQ